LHEKKTVWRRWTLILNFHHHHCWSYTRINLGEQILKGPRGVDQTTTSSSIASGDVIVIVDFVYALADCNLRFPWDYFLCDWCLLWLSSVCDGFFCFSMTDLPRRFSSSLVRCWLVLRPGRSDGWGGCLCWWAFSGRFPGRPMRLTETKPALHHYVGFWMSLVRSDGEMLSRWTTAHARRRRILQVTKSWAESWTTVCGRHSA